MAIPAWLPSATKKTWRNPRTGESFWDGGANIRKNPLLGLHTTEGHQSCPGYQNSRGQAGGYAPNFTVVVKKREFFQHIPMNRAGRAFNAYNEQAVQVEITGSCSKDWAKKAGLVHVDDFTKEDIAFLVKCLKEIASACGIPWTAPFPWASYEALATGRTSVRQSIASIAAASGIVGHQHMSSNTHLDPGSLGNLLVGTGIHTTPAPNVVAPATQNVAPWGAEFIKQLQRAYKMSSVDGVVSSPSALVQAIQRDLNSKLAKSGKISVLAVDGMLGPATRAAIQKWLGAKSWNETAALWQKRLSPAPKPAPAQSATPSKQSSTPKIKNVLQVGSKGEEVKLLQREFRTWFSYAKDLAVDGSYGPMVKADVAEFQRRAKLSGHYSGAVDGVFGPGTLAAARKMGLNL